MLTGTATIQGEIDLLIAALLLPRLPNLQRTDHAPCVEPLCYDGDGAFCPVCGWEIAAAEVEP